MEDGSFVWIYLIFFLIPLARIIPRVIRKLQNKDNTIKDNHFNPNFQQPEQRHETLEKSESFVKQESSDKPLDVEMQVLREINNGNKDFNRIQKNVGIDNQKLENILDDFEEKGLMRVVNKSGITGNKIEIHPTEKGFKKFYK